MILQPLMTSRTILGLSWKTATILGLTFSWLLLPSQAVSLRPQDRLAEQWWASRHDHCLRMTTYGRADVAFLGDSITQGWEESGELIWDTEIAPFKAANFGFSGDRTDHVQWRLQNGELIGMHPKLVVVMIGTNNLSMGGTPEQTATSVCDIVKYLTTNLPKSKVLLLAIFPRGVMPSNPYRERVSQANEIIKSCADGRRVQYLDLAPAFLSPDGTLSADTFPDSLHPNVAGYKIWSDAIRPTIKKMLGR